MDSRMAVLMLTLFDTVCKFPWGLTLCDITRQLTIDSKFLLFGESCNMHRIRGLSPSPSIWTARTQSVDTSPSTPAERQGEDQSKQSHLTNQKGVFSHMTEQGREY